MALLLLIWEPSFGFWFQKRFILNISLIQHFQASLYIMIRWADVLMNTLQISFLCFKIIESLQYSQSSRLRSLYMVQRLLLVLVKLENILNSHDNQWNNNSSWECGYHSEKLPNNGLWADISITHGCHCNQDKIYVVIVETQGFG